MPAMMLQTLVENAIKHGLEPRTAGGTVWIRARATDGSVAITVADDGNGFNTTTGGTGIGLKNVRERLRLMFGGDAALAVVANFPAGVAATISVPAAAGSTQATHSTPPPVAAASWPMQPESTAPNTVAGPPAVNPADAPTPPAIGPATPDTGDHHG
jgi:hypothetical protein